MSCKWAGSDRPRVLSGRHLDDCWVERAGTEAARVVYGVECEGCQPCTEPHCRVDGKTHAEGTCAECMAEAREALHDIARMCDSLPEEVEHRGVEGEAMMLLGPAADPEARGHLEASVLAGRVPADYLADAVGETHPVWVLGTWSMVWRDALEHTDDALDLPVLVDYLDRTMTYMGGYEHVPFEDFARDLRRCRTHMEAVLHDGEQVERGAPCWSCKRPLLHVWGPRVVDDRWVCENNRCEEKSFTTAQYRGWVEEDARNAASRLTAADMALRFTDEDYTLKASVVRVWGARDLVRKRGSNGQGMTLYDVADVEARVTRSRAGDDDAGDAA